MDLTVLTEQCDNLKNEYLELDSRIKEIGEVLKCPITYEQAVSVLEWGTSNIDGTSPKNARIWCCTDIAKNSLVFKPSLYNSEVVRGHFNADALTFKVSGKYKIIVKLLLSAIYNVAKEKLEEIDALEIDSKEKILKGVQLENLITVFLGLDYCCSSFDNGIPFDWENAEPQDKYLRYTGEVIAIKGLEVFVEGIIENLKNEDDPYVSIDTWGNNFTAQSTYITTILNYLNIINNFK